MNSDIDEWQYQSNVFLVRHATSEFNLVFQCLLENNATVEEIVKEGSDIKYRDCSLADVGIKECEEMLNSIKDLNVHTVFISPLLRSVQTAYHLFKGHPKFESIRFVIVPKAREALIAMDDIPLIYDFASSKISDQFPNLDLSLFDEYKNKSLYFYEDLEESLRSELDPLIKPDSSDPLGNNSFPIIRKRLIEAYPNKFESVYNIYKRAETVKQMIKDYIQKYEVDFDEKIVLISHENFLKVYTGKWEDGQINEDMKDPKCSLKYSWSDETESLIKFKNCIFVPDPNDYS